jgi:hypothetical protein
MSRTSHSPGPANPERGGARAIVLGIACLLFFLSACATVGRDFETARVADIQIGKTTQADIEAMFGKPWRTGIEDGLRTWTYGKYRYSVFSKTSTRDLVVRFDKNNVVSSYTFNTTEPATATKQTK